MQYRLGGRKGRTRRVTIGRHGEITPTFARAEAKRLLGEIATGHDPAAERDKTRADKSLAVVLEQFMTEHVKPKLKATTVEGYQRVARLYILSALGRRLIGEVTRADIARLHHELRAKPYQATHADCQQLEPAVTCKSFLTGKLPACLDRRRLTFAEAA